MTCFELAQRWEAGVPVLGVSGELDLQGAAALLARSIDVAQHGAGSIVCDLRAMDDPSSSHLLTAFPAAQRRIGTWPRKRIYLAGATPAVALLLEKLRIHRFMSVHSTLDSALSAARQDEQAVHRAIRLAPLMSSPAQARRYVDTLIAPVPADVQDVIRIVVSELTTNVVLHVQCPFVLSLALSPGGVLIAVTDRSRQEPILRPVRAAASDGRGIQLVDALSAAWGVRLVHQKGKTVWAKIATSAA